MRELQELQAGLPNKKGDVQAAVPSVGSALTLAYHLFLLDVPRPRVVSGWRFSPGWSSFKFLAGGTANRTRYVMQNLGHTYIYRYRYRYSIYIY